MAFQFMDVFSQGYIRTTQGSLRRIRLVQRLPANGLLKALKLFYLSDFSDIHSVHASTTENTLYQDQLNQYPSSST